jgi:uncharacterized protein (TIGR02147 family)
MMQMTQWQKAFRTTLIQEFQTRQTKNPRYSLRSFARSLQTSPATLSLILRGAEQWNLSSKLALNILELAKVPETTKNWIQKKMGESVEANRSTLSESHYDLLTGWLNSVVYTFLELPAEQRTVEAIAKKTKIPTKVIQGTLDLLLERGLVAMDEQGQYLQKTPDLNAGDGLPNKKIRAHHLDSLQLAELALDKIEAGNRDFTTQTFVGRMETLAQVKKEIRDFHGRVAAIMDEGDQNDQVFRMTVALFPFDFKEDTSR